MMAVSVFSVARHSTLGRRALAIGGAAALTLALVLPSSAMAATAPTATAVSPISKAPANGLLKWSYTPGSSGASQKTYSLQVSWLASFATLATSSAPASSTATSWQVPAGYLGDNGIYYWRVKVYDGATWSAWSATATFLSDITLPVWSTFTSSTGLGGAQYNFKWGMATDLNGIAGYDTFLQVVYQNGNWSSCNVTWPASGTVYVRTAVPSKTVTVPNGYCGRLAVRAVDKAGNTSSFYYSNAVIGDTLAPAAPTVTNNANSLPTGYDDGTTIWIGGNVGDGTINSTVTFGATGIDSQSGIASSTLATSVSGGTPYARLIAGNPVSWQVSWRDATRPLSVSITTTDTAGNTSSPTLRQIRGDANFPTITLPAGSSSPVTVHAKSYDFIYGVTDAESGFGRAATPYFTPGWHFQRQVGTLNAYGMCDGFANDTTAGNRIAGNSQVANGTWTQALVPGNCYRWELDATDNTGNELGWSAGEKVTWLNVYVDPSAL
jgi:hypothetical protein